MSSAHAEGRAAAGDAAASAVKPRRCKDCGKPLHWQYARCTICLTTHREKSRERKAAISAAVLTPERREHLLALVAAGTAFSAACDQVGVTPPHVHGFRRYDAQWGVALDKALMEGRDPKLPHGTAYTYRWHKCRCPECRTAHEGTRHNAPASASPVPEQRTERVRARVFLTGHQRRQAWRHEQDRARLKQLLPFIEQGMTVRAVLQRFGLRPRDLERMRRTLPEARQAILDACAIGKEKRRKNALSVQRPRQDEIARAVQLIVAAAATCRSLDDACKAGGATPEWVDYESQRNDAFRQALTAAASVNPAIDLKGWHEEVDARRWPGKRPPNPRPPQASDG